MKKHLKVLAATMLAGLALSACGGDTNAAAEGEETSQETTTVKVGIVQLPIFAPIYVAEAKGYFDEAGLDVQLETVKSGQDAVPLASSGKLDVVAAGFSAGMFSAIETGLDIKVVASMGVSDGDAEKSPTDLVVSKAKVDSGEITDIADLKGKKVGAAGGAGGTGAFLLSLALEEEGLTINDVEIVNLGNPDMPTALANGSLDAGLISAPFSTMAIEDGTGVSMAVPPAGTSGTGMLYGGQFAGTESAQKFFDAVARAAKDLQGEDRYSDENLKIIGEATGQTVEELKSVPLYTWLPNVKPLPEQLKGMEAVWMASGAIEYKEAIDQGSYIDSSFSEKTP